MTRIIYRVQPSWRVFCHTLHNIIFCRAVACWNHNYGVSDQACTSCNKSLVSNVCLDWPCGPYLCATRVWSTGTWSTSLDLGGTTNFGRTHPRIHNVPYQREVGSDSSPIHSSPTVDLRCCEQTRLLLWRQICNSVYAVSNLPFDRLCPVTAADTEVVVTVALAVNSSHMLSASAALRHASVTKASMQPSELFIALLLVRK